MQRDGSLAPCTGRENFRAYAARVTVSTGAAFAAFFCTGKVKEAVKAGTAASWEMKGSSATWRSGKGRAENPLID